MAKSVRYIKCSLAGSTYNNDNHFCEVMAMEGATNRAAGIIASGSVPITNAAYITDGNILSSTYAGVGNGAQWIKLDLGAAYDLDLIKVYHYYTDGRTYHSTKLEVSLDDAAYETVFDSSVLGEYSEVAANFPKIIVFLDDPADVTGANGWNNPGAQTSGNFTSLSSNGWRFSPNADIVVTGLRVKSSYTQDQKLNLWDMASASLIGTVTVSGVAGSWVAGSFATPVSLTKDKEYIVAANVQATGRAFYYRSSPALSEFNGSYIQFKGARINGTVDGLPPSYSTSTPAVDLVFDFTAEQPAADGIYSAIFI